jgi:hypothetical protein
MEQTEDHEIAIIVSNTHDASCGLVVEPWGFPYDMPPGASFAIVFRSLVDPVPPNTIISTMRELTSPSGAAMGAVLPFCEMVRCSHPVSLLDRLSRSSAYLKILDC